MDTIVHPTLNQSMYGFILQCNNCKSLNCFINIKCETTNDYPKVWITYKCNNCGYQSMAEDV